MKTLFPVFILALSWLPLLVLNADVLYVPGNYQTIQSAMNSASEGDTVLVAPGIYYENVNFRGKGVVLASYFLTNHDTSYISSTVINGSTPVHPDTASCVVMLKPNISSAGDTSAALVGFTLTGGIGTVVEDIHYPGYFFREGGGIVIQYWSPRIRFNRIIGNHIDNDSLHTGGGGGIRCGDGNPKIENNVFQNNSGHCGTAVNLYFSSGILRNNIVTENYGGHVWGAGAIYTYKNCLSYPILIENNAVISNSSISGCGGLRIYSSNNVLIKNNIVWGNLPSQMYVSGGSVTISYCDIQGGCSGTGNIDVNPGFINNTFFLSPASPCIDAGDTAAGYNDPEDTLNPGFALLPALGTIRNDMGAFGGPYSAFIGYSVVGIKNNGNSSVITNFALYQNYPNPFNPVTNINYDVYERNLITLKVFDLLGREVKTLVNRIQNAGSYSVSFDAENLSSGTYFYRLESDKFSDTKKFVILK